MPQHLREDWTTADGGLQMKRARGRGVVVAARLASGLIAGEARRYAGSEAMRRTAVRILTIIVAAPRCLYAQGAEAAPSGFHGGSARSNAGE